jgi:hypothetical protein
MKEQLEVLQAVAEDLRRTITGYDKLASLSGEYRTPDWESGRHALEVELTMVTKSIEEMSGWIPASAA